MQLSNFPITCKAYNDEHYIELVSLEVFYYFLISHYEMASQMMYVYVGMSQKLSVTIHTESERPSGLF